MPDHDPGWSFPGTERFRVEARLGAGASGEVYRVHDRRFGHVVALKTLHRADAGTVYRFKKEFRALADLTHRNLVRLYELCSEGSLWFFTMELVEGLDFLSWVRESAIGVEPPEDGEHDEQATLAMSVATQERLQEVLRHGPRELAPSAPPCDLERLRDALAQLASALMAVHHAGKLHCDIKPSNIRITPAGRTVLLDFGLVQQLAVLPGDHSIVVELSGTPAYMSPEQAGGAPLTPASDWYAVGALLYEALTGRAPHRDDPQGILAAKQRVDPPPPRLSSPAVPADLDQLCVELLARDPRARPHGGEVLRRLSGRGRTVVAGPSTTSPETAEADAGDPDTGGAHGGAGTEDAGSGERGATDSPPPFLDRRAELDQLETALAQSRHGARLVLVHGDSGLGKSRLIEHFLAQVHRRHREAVILSGRCYERESVPFKALDAAIDALSRHLRVLEPPRLDPLLPSGLRALVRLFPVLDRVEGIAWSARQQPEVADEGERRRQARGALRQLLARIAARHPTIIAIDDLHWGDVDSIELLAELLRPPEEPALLLVASYREEDRERSPALRRLLASDLLDRIETSRVALAPLQPERATELAVHLLGDRSARTLPLAQLIAREARGSPFFVDQLVRMAQSQALAGGTFDLRADDSVDASFERWVRARVAGLSPGAARLLATIVAAGRPLDLELALTAAELGDDAPAAVAELRAQNLMRIGSDGAVRRVEPYDNRLGEVVYRTLGRKLQRRAHRRLARALETAGDADPEILAEHHRAAGERRRATRLAIAAAERATGALAFDRAARLYRLALEETAAGDGRRDLGRRLGDALAAAGRGGDAAAAYLEAAAVGGDDVETLELRRRAAEQQLSSGLTRAGLSQARAVLGELGVRLPGYGLRGRALARWHRLRLAMGGIVPASRGGTALEPREALRLDACRALAVGLLNVDPALGQGFSSRHLRLAQAAGEPRRLTLALALEAAYASLDGARGRRRGARLLRAARRLAEADDEPRARALILLAEGLAAQLGGDGPRALPLFEQAEELLRERSTGATWEIDTAGFYRLRLLCWLGRWRQVAAELPARLRDASSRGDRYAEGNLLAGVAWSVALAADRPDEARAAMSRAGELGRGGGFRLQHALRLAGRVELALYRGAAAEAHRRTREAWPLLRRGGLLRLEPSRWELVFLRLRAALAAAAGSPADHRPLLREARGLLRRLAREPSPWAPGLVALGQAGVLSFDRDREATRRALDRAAAGLETAGLRLHAAAARHRRGILRRDREDRRAAERLLEAEGVTVPARLAAVLAPGRWGGDHGGAAQRPS